MSLRSWARSKGTLQLKSENREATVSQLVDRYGYGRSSATTAGVIVNDSNALTHAAVWGCVDVIAELVSTKTGIPVEVLAGT